MRRDVKSNKILNLGAGGNKKGDRFVVGYHKGYVVAPHQNSYVESMTLAEARKEVETYDARWKIYELVRTRKKPRRRFENHRPDRYEIAAAMSFTKGNLERADAMLRQFTIRRK